MSRLWILYDGRACASAGTDDASVLVACDSEEEAEGFKADYGQSACYSYAITDNEITDEKWEWDYHPTDGAIL